MKISQKVHENKNKEIINIFNDKTLGEPLTDTCIFYLPFQFLVDEKKEIINLQHKVIKSEAKALNMYDYNSNQNNNSNRKFLKNNQYGKSENNLFCTYSKKNLYKKDSISKNGNTTNYVRNSTKPSTSRISTISSLSERENFEENNEDIKVIDNIYYLEANSSSPAGYTILTQKHLNKTTFSQYSAEQRKNQPIVDIDTLKKLYLINKGAEWVKKEKKKKKKEEKNEDENKDKEENIYIIKTVEDNGIEKVKFSSQCFYESKQSIEIKSSDVKEMKIPEEIMEKININYKDYINFVDVDEYLKTENKKDFFLLKLDLKDPECIALLQQVGKGNYGVVKKTLMFKDNKYIPKAIKFTCVNSEYENATKDNIEKEIFAGKVAKLVNSENIAYVQDYMTINNFISRKNNKERENINLPEVWEEYLSKECYDKFQENKQNIKECFENNVFKDNKKISGPLYVMIMDLIDGEDLFKNNDNINIDDLGDVLSKVLINCFNSKVALNDIKAKNVIFDKEKNKFSIIDIQTLEKTTSDLSDSLGTPEYWPFFKTLNINFEKLQNVKDDNLLNIYCNNIDNNFVDTYAACMTMYFTKFHTLTAAGLLTLLFKWIVLEEENKGKKEWKEFPLDKKIEFLSKYEQNYERYINFMSRNKKNIVKDLEKLFNDTEIKVDNNINEKLSNEKDNSDIFNIEKITFFFENIDDRNLNKKQKNNLANLLNKVISSKYGSDIFYFLEEIKENFDKINGQNNFLNENDINNIINFYKNCVNKDFENFTKLSGGKNRYDDFIKYILYFGSCLNYNKDQKISNAEDFLKKIELKEIFEENEGNFFKDENNNNISTIIKKLESSFNQKFINDLLKIFPLDKYYNITNLNIKNREIVKCYLEKDFPNLKNNNFELNKKMKVFYLLYLLEKNKVLHVPRSFIKLFSLIKEKNIKN